MTAAVLEPVEPPADEPVGPPPPHDIGAEQCALGAMMLAREVIVEVSEILSAGKFYRPAHGTIFDAIVNLDAEGEPADAYSVASHLAAKGMLGKVGGADYLHTLISAVPLAANGPHYARTVADRAASRELQRAAMRIGHLAATKDPGEALELAMHMLADLEGVAPTATDGPRPWAEVALEVLEEIQAACDAKGVLPGIPTGLYDLDRLTAGLHPGQVIVVGARPGVGKTILIGNIAQNAAWKHKYPVAMFSLEMSATEVGKRLISADSRVPLNYLKDGTLGEQDWVKVHDSIADSTEAPLFIDDTPGLTVGEIRARARKLHRKYGGLSLVVVDYLQLIEAPRGENRQVAVAAISRGLKLLAKQLGVPVLVAAALNRNPENRPDKRPTSADLKESGGIEADADVVILIHREDHYDPESSRAGEADLIVDKNRSGPRDTVTVAAQLHLARFQSMAFEDAR